MAEAATLARPYAEAAYRLAREKNALDEWSRSLGLLAAIGRDKIMRELINDPNVSADALERVVLSVADGKLSDDAKRFTRTLIDNRRMLVLPEIETQFRALQDAASGVVDARVITAFALDTAALADIALRLEKRLNKKVRAVNEVDPSIIGGMRVEAGDTVIDASVKTGLDNMAVALKR